MGRPVPDPPSPPYDPPGRVTLGRYSQSPGPLYPRQNPGVTDPIEPELESNFDRVIRNPWVINIGSCLGTWILVGFCGVIFYGATVDLEFRNWVVTLFLALVILGVVGYFTWELFQGIRKYWGALTQDPRKPHDD